MRTYQCGVFQRGEGNFLGSYVTGVSASPWHIDLGLEMSQSRQRCSRRRAVALLSDFCIELHGIGSPIQLQVPTNQHRPISQSMGRFGTLDPRCLLGDDYRCITEVRPWYHAASASRSADRTVPDAPSPCRRGTAGGMACNKLTMHRFDAPWDLTSRSLGIRDSTG